MAKQFAVYGPPGCGKTTWLSRQTQRAAERFTPSDVVVASLTRTAAQEVAGRRTGIPRKNVGTLHAHAFRALDHPEIADVAEGFAAWNEWIERGPLKIRGEVAADVLDAPPSETVGFVTEGEVRLAEYGVMRNRMVPRELWRPTLREFAERWETFKSETGRRDFTDLIEDSLHDVGIIPGNPRVLMLDEAQDMSRLEMRLARKWGERCEDFVIVGDPDQCLYEWRGTDPEEFGAGELAGEKVLSQSYRVPAAVHGYAVDWIGKIAERKQVEYLPRDAEGSVELVRAGWSSPEAIVKGARQDLVQGRSVMILATCGFMLEPVTRALKKQGVPFHNPYRLRHGGWNPLRAAGRVLAFLRADRDAWGDQAREPTWDDLRKWSEPLIARGVFTHGSKSAIEVMCSPGTFGGEMASRQVPIDELAKLLEPDHLGPAIGMDLDWWESNLRAKRKQTYAYPLEVARQHGRGALREEPRLVVGTIHSVKGGEADVVYVCPDMSRRAVQEFRRPAGRAATIRQFYVAFTRAREHLRICRPSGAWYIKLPQP